MKLKEKESSSWGPPPRREGANSLFQTAPLSSLLPANRYFLFMRQLRLGFWEGVEMEAPPTPTPGCVGESLRIEGWEAPP